MPRIYLRIYTDHIIFVSLPCFPFRSELDIFNKLRRPCYTLCISKKVTSGTGLGYYKGPVSYHTDRTQPIMSDNKYDSEGIKISWAVVSLVAPRVPTQIHGDAGQEDLDYRPPSETEWVSVVSETHTNRAAVRKPLRHENPLIRQPFWNASLAGEPRARGGPCV